MLNIIVSKNQRYTCLQCGKCCRRFNVRIEPHEIQRIQELDWGDEPHPVDFYETIHGYTYFKRKPDGGCVFLNDQGVCSIHARFGYEAKALTCRGYPMNIISVSPHELSVLARMDCPAVLANHGKPLLESRGDIMQLVSEMTFGQGFDEHARSGMQRPTVDFICRELHKMLRDTQLPLPRRLRWILLLSDQCKRLGPSFLNDLPTLKKVWINLQAKSAQQAVREPAGGAPGPWQRLMFRAWLALYTRRDEEQVSRGLGARLKNFKNNLAFILGFGNWQTMGQEHPALSSRQAKLFTQHLDLTYDEELWRPYMDFLVNRIDTMQFFGAAFYNQPFEQGLRALMTSFPLVLATAKMHAAARNSLTLNRQDLFNAVLSIDHCHGRSPALNSVSARIYEAFIADHFLIFSSAF